MMDILCLMGLFPREYEDQIIKDSLFGVQNAANKLQWAIVHGLDENNGKPVTICNSLYIGAYPKKYRQKNIPSFAFSHTNGANDVNIGFTNIAGIKILSRYIGVWDYLNNWAKSNTEEDKCVVVYAMTLPFVKLLHDIKKKYKHIKVCLVVPDLPEYMNVTAMQTNLKYRTMKKIEIAYLRKCLSNIDNYVFLTEHMKNWFNRQINYVVVEGISSDKAPQYNKKEMFLDENKHIVYTGGIKREYGVFELISSFMEIITGDWVLDIFGDGVHFEEAKKMAAGDGRVIFHGSVPNSLAVQAQQEADLLVNPRPNYEFAKYSFPSKILEYMLSGNPMLAYKLDGIPSEYDNYYFHIEDEKNGFVHSLCKVMEMNSDERKQMGKKAQEFVLNNKTPKIQAGKIMKLLGERL